MKQEADAIFDRAALPTKEIWTDARAWSVKRGNKQTDVNCIYIAAGALELVLSTTLCVRFFDPPPLCLFVFSFRFSFAVPQPAPPPFQNFAAQLRDPFARAARPSMSAAASGDTMTDDAQATMSAATATAPAAAAAAADDHTEQSAALPVGRGHRQRKAKGQRQCTHDINRCSLCVNLWAWTVAAHCDGRCSAPADTAA
jgi:hypothetical protein